MRSPLASGLACLALSGMALAQNDTIVDDTYFYGQVPATYPTPQLTEDGEWGDAVARAKELVAQMTLEEKVSMTGGTNTSNTGCNGYVLGIERLGFPGLCLQDAGQGLRDVDYVSAFPAGLHVGASWNKKLAHSRAVALGKEARTKGVNVLLGPAIGPLGRVVSAGRNWEGFSIDPYLTGRLVYETVSGIQSQGVITSTKHLVAQEQETHRRPTRQGPFQEAVSSNVDDRTMHELYLWPFYDAVHAGTGNVMCSYQKLNNMYTCQNSAAQNGLLKDQLGFQGWIVSDWNAMMSGVASALSGMDVAMPNGGIYWGGNLTRAVNNGSVPIERLDDMVTRVLASWYQMGQDEGFPDPGYGIASNLSLPHRVVDARSKCSKPTLFDGAVEGHVLVKNENNALPLKPENMKMISLFGYAAAAPRVGAIEEAWRYGAQGTNLTIVRAGFGGPNNYTSPEIAINGSLITGGGSGATGQAPISAPYDALVAQAYEDGTALSHSLDSATPTVNPTSDACIVVGNVWAAEGYDRISLRDAYTDNLILHVADRCANTIVVFQNAGTRLVDTFVDHPNVTAIVFGHVGGQDAGSALISLLYGKSSFSGRLPYTVARTESDYGDTAWPDVTRYQDGGRFARCPQSDFTEGTLVDYRHFDELDIEPRYEFGFGLSYTTFEYSDLEITKAAEGRFDAYPVGPVLQGGQADLWDELVTVSATVSNVGDVDSKEVAQLYLGIPDEGAPVRQLRGFEKPMIEAGESVTVEFALTRRDLSVWDVVAQKWRLPEGEFRVYVGRSSRDLPLEGSISI